jgi:hypothetical protein
MDIATAQPQQPGPDMGPQPDIGGPPKPLEEPITLTRPKNWTSFLLPHLGHASLRPFSFSEMEANTSVFSLQSMQMYS